LLMGILSIQNTYAMDDWLCTEESSVKRGNSIYACGVSKTWGQYTEDAARYEAFKNAQLEFLIICNMSDDCKNHSFDVESKRTTCEPMLDGQNEIYGYKCYRLVVFTSTSRYRDSKALLYP